MAPSQLLFVTGKGGVGKTTVAAALGCYAADRGQRTLIIETASDGSLAQLFGHRRLRATPQHLTPRLDAVCVDARQLVEDYFRKLLRFAWLSDRLLSSTTFNALTAAAPGITEFLLLERILDWVQPPFGARRHGYDLVIVDGPASGHMRALLATPRRIAGMVARGPIGSTARTLDTLIADHTRTSVLLVSLPEEMAIREAIETEEALRRELGIRIERPVINRVFPAYFDAGEAERIAEATDSDDASRAAIRDAAQFALVRARECDKQVRALRRGLRLEPLLVHHFFARHVRADDLGPVATTIGPVLLGGSPS